MERLFFEFVIRAAFLVAATAVVLYVMRIRPAAARHRVWGAVVVAMLLLPIWTAWGPRVSLRLLPALPDTTRDAAILAAPAASTRAVTSPRITTLQAFLLGVYSVGLGWFLFRFVLGTVRARRLVRDATLHNGIRTISLCASPVTVGLLRPVIIFPEHWQQWPQAQLDAVLAHEGEHARRHDPLVQWIALLNRALFWFHPAAWWLERKLSALAEEACDDHVLARGHHPGEYAEYLIDIARLVSRSGARVDITGMAMPGSFLSQRIRRILQGSPVQCISRTRMVFLVVACSITCTMFAAGALDHIRRDSGSHAASEPSESTAAARPATKFVLGDLKIEGQVHDREGIRARVLKQWSDREYSNVKELEDEVLEVGVRADFQDRGYFKVVVTQSSSPLMRVVDEKQQVQIIAAVTEGEQFRLRNFTIQNASPGRPLAIPAATLQKQFQLRDGDLFSVVKIRAGLEGAQRLYTARGYKQTALEPATNVDEARHLIDFTLRITEGPHTE
jgi:beta-lactamase regulating signal transducer with metallopeptidase domain